MNSFFGAMQREMVSRARIKEKDPPLFLLAPATSDGLGMR